MQARYTLVLTATVPLLAALTVGARRRPEPRFLQRGLDWPVAIAITEAALTANLIALYFNLKRYATGDRAAGFLRHVAWSPPGGITLEIVLATVGALLLTVAVLGTRSLPRPQGTAHPNPN